jgi:hypothetical protein
MAFTSWMPGSRKRETKGLRKTYSSNEYTPADLLPPVRLYFLQFTQFPKTMSTAGDQALNT